MQAKERGGTERERRVYIAGLRGPPQEAPKAFTVASRIDAEPGAILEGKERIRKLNGHEVSPMANPLRPDEPAPCLTQEEALRNAPEKADGFFVIPRLDG